MKKKIFIGVAWPYVNGDIHIGHLAGYLLPSDIFARFHRFLGNEVLMVSGSDCFGTPITLEADKRKVFPKDIVEEYHAKNVALFKKLGLTFDNYTKTDTENHKKIVQDFFLRLLAKDLIFKKTAKQYYSPEEKRFLPDRYVEGICPHCGYSESRSDQCDKCGALMNEGELKNPKSKLSKGKVELKSTEHYFMDWPRLQKFLESYVEAKGAQWRKWILDETKGWLKKGLEPRAITRDLDWGVEIPVERIPQNMLIDNAEHKRIYVWFEAVIGYLSASLEYTKNWEDWWKDEKAEHYYFMGKDNLVFHTLFWPGQLHVYDETLHVPDVSAINQFLNLEGQKFSKSRGITISSDYMADTYGVDVLRFYLCLIMPENADANFTWSDFAAKNNNILIGNLGNFINRTLTLGTSLDFKNAEIEKEITDMISQKMSVAKTALLNCEFKKYLEVILSLSDFGNKYIAEKEPWALKGEPEKLTRVIGNALSIVLALQTLIKPLMPETAEKLSRQISFSAESWPEDESDFLKKGVAKIKIGDVRPLFNKLDEKIVEEEKLKLKL